MKSELTGRWSNPFVFFLSFRFVPSSFLAAFHFFILFISSFTFFTAIVVSTLCRPETFKASTTQIRLSSLSLNQNVTLHFISREFHSRILSSSSCFSFLVCRSRWIVFQGTFSVRKTEPGSKIVSRTKCCQKKKFCVLIFRILFPYCVHSVQLSAKSFTKMIQ